MQDNWIYYEVAGNKRTSICFFLQKNEENNLAETG